MLVLQKRFSQVTEGCLPVGVAEVAVSVVPAVVFAEPGVPSL